MEKEPLPPYHLELEKLRVRSLFKQNDLAQLASLFNACIYLYISQDLVPKRQLAFWFFCLLALIVMRRLYLKTFIKKHCVDNANFNPVVWENRFAAGVFLSGLTWGAAGSIMLPSGSVVHHAFVGFILAGMTSGCAAAYGTSRKSAQAFLWPTLLPFLFTLVLDGAKYNDAMGMLVVCYILSFSRLIWKINKQTMESLKLRFEKNELSEEVKSAQAQALHSSKMAALGEMAGGIAHEINNPLGIIRGSNELILELALAGKLNPETLQPLFEKIDVTVVRIAKIISGLKCFAREGRADPFEKVPVKTLIDETLAFCMLRLKNHEIALEVGPIPEKSEIECQRIQLSQVLLNLLNNSFDAVVSSPSKWVKIEVNETRADTSFIITDSGHGVPQEIRHKITQPFFTTKEVGRGTGLGLSISKGIVEKHRGTLILDSTSPHTRFVITLPKSQTSEGKAAA